MKKKYSDDSQEQCVALIYPGFFLADKDPGQCYLHLVLHYILVL